MDILLKGVGHRETESAFLMWPIYKMNKNENILSSNNLKIMHFKK